MLLATLASACVICAHWGHAGYIATAATCIGREEGRIQRGLASCQACQSFHNDTVTALGSSISAADSRFRSETPNGYGNELALSLWQMV